MEILDRTLAVGVISSGTGPVLAIHGISSQRRLWNWLQAAAPDLSLIMPDLRGRCDSADVQGPSPSGRHAAEMIAVLDHLGLDAAHVYGMSMGGFATVALAVRPVAGVDHAASIMSPVGVSAAASLIRDALDAEARS